RLLRARVVIGGLVAEPQVQLANAGDVHRGHRLHEVAPLVDRRRPPAEVGVLADEDLRVEHGGIAEQHVVDPRHARDGAGARAVETDLVTRARRLAGYRPTATTRAAAAGVR